MTYPTLAFWSFLAGVGIPLVGVFNSALARTIGSPVAATAVTFLVAFLAASEFAVASGGTSGIGGLPAAPLRGFLPGLIMGFYALSATILIPRFGVGNFVLFILVAQVSTSAVVDHLGLFGVVRRPVDGLRLAGLAVAAAGLVITQIAAQRAAPR